MPYVTREARAELTRRNARTAGELNYEVTLLLDMFIEDHGLGYETINAVLGAVEGAKQEFYRRVAVPYEEERRRVNGDVYKMAQEGDDGR